jgi:DNA polymerase-3 subunit gamma/tau
MGRVERICAESGMEIQKEAARLIARMADGAMRDALSILDQCISLGTSEILYKDVLSVVGIVNDTFMADMVDALGERSVSVILEFVDRLVMEGKDIGQFVSDLVIYYRNLLICKVTKKPQDIIEASVETLERMTSQAAGLDREEIIFIIKELSLLQSNLKWANHPRVLLEVSLIKLCENSFSVDTENLMDRLAVLERKISSGTFTVKGESAAAKTLGGEAEIPQREKRPSRKPTEEAASMSAPVDMGKELGCWKEVISELKAMGRMMIYTNLLNTKAVEQEDRWVGIVFDKGADFAKLIVSKAENLEVIQTVLVKKLGKEVRVRCLSVGTAAVEQKKDELVEKLESLARKGNIPLNVFEE